MTDKISQSRLIELRALISEGNEHAFYDWPEWRYDIRPRVLLMDHFECQCCKRAGRYSKAIIVHHIRHLKEYPEFALSIYAPDGTRQLESVCKRCHERLHPESQRQYVPKAPPITLERWD